MNEGIEGIEGKIKLFVVTFGTLHGGIILAESALKRPMATECIWIWKIDLKIFSFAKGCRREAGVSLAQDFDW